VPSNVAASPGINSISVSWGASSDDVGVAGYTVRRDTVVVATSGGTTYLDTGLAASTTYSYTVSAFDAAGNASVQSAPVPATTAAAPPPDTLPPSMPGNLAATPSTNAISLTWSASTDNIGVTGYVVRRGGTPVATRTVTNYLDTGLVASTSYSYTVSAVDAAGNESPETAPVAQTTLAAGTASTLAQLAASLAPGQWATLSSNNFNLALVDAGDARSILEFASRGHWDPVHKKIQFWGEGHFAGQALITYDDATNSWSKDTTVVNSNIGHGYQHLALNPANGDLYLRLYSSGSIRKKPYGQPWQNAASFNNNNQQVAGALEWVPQLNGGAGGLAFADTGGVRISNAAVSSWGSQINGASGPYHNNGVATNGAFYFGGGNGSSAFWRLDPVTGTVTAAASAPAQYGVTARHLVAHPNGIDALLVGPAGSGSVYRYNGASNTWTNLGAHQLNADTWWAGITVPEYGVTVWLCQDSSVSAPFIRVYKP
jgi:chitodextrinase